MNKLYTRFALLILGAAFTFSVIAGCQPNTDIQPGANTNYDKNLKGKGKPQANQLD